MDERDRIDIDKDIPHSVVAAFMCDAGKISLKGTYSFGNLLRVSES